LVFSQMDLRRCLVSLIGAWMGLVRSLMGLVCFQVGLVEFQIVVQDPRVGLMVSHVYFVGFQTGHGGAWWVHSRRCGFLGTGKCVHGSQLVLAGTGLGGGFCQALGIIVMTSKIRFELLSWTAPFHWSQTHRPHSPVQGASAWDGMEDGGVAWGR
jgi:hypothetical protein